MATLMAALEGTLAPGIYRLSAAVDRGRLGTLCQIVDAQLFDLDGQTIRSKDQFLQAIARSLHFPDYFGGTWDALADCLTDVEQGGMSRCVLLYTQPEHFMDAAPADAAIALEILQDAIASWQTENVQFYVLLQTARESLGDTAVPDFVRLED
jgi:Barstar (barnase inhibitor)